MASHAVERPHSAPGRFSGIIHFRGQWAYLENPQHTDWSLLQFDEPYTGLANPDAAATTAARLRGSYQESDEVVFHGILSDQSFGAVPFCILFVC